MTIININVKLSDIAWHCRKQGIELDVIKAYSLFYDSHKALYGSFKNATPYEYHMNGRYEYITNKIWDIIEFKIKTNTYMLL